MTPFEREVQARIAVNSHNAILARSAQDFLLQSIAAKYSYNFFWLGRPIIQYPQDMMAMQEIIWRVRPDLIIETGIAHGGSLIHSASMLALLDYCEAAAVGGDCRVRGGRRRVLGVDIDIRAHNRQALKEHPLQHLVEMIEGSSIDPAVIQRVRERAAGSERVLVCLDSNHTHDHVLAELEAYAGLASLGSYCVVFDTIIADMPQDAFPDRPWSPRDNPRTAVRQFLASHPEFAIDTAIQDKLLITAARDGYLQRIA